jgi:hypothetical protein
MSSSEEANDVLLMLMPCPKMQVMSFAVSVPAATTMDTVSFDDEFYMETVGAAMQELGILSAPKQKPTANTTFCAFNPKEGIGMVRTTTILKSSIIVWFGWARPLRTMTL